MTKFLSIAIVGVCVVSGASVRAQVGPASPDGSTGRSSSVKELNATGRMTEPCVRASKLVGAQVNDRSGDRVAQIHDLILNPHTGRIDFALLSLNETPAGANAARNSSEDLVPLPWVLLKTPAAAEYSDIPEHLVFTLNTDKNKLGKAPKVDWEDPNQSEWRQRIYAYYGVTPQPAAGGAESEQGQIKGKGARQLEENTPQSPPMPPPHP